MNSADCVKELIDYTENGISASFLKLMLGDKTSWKRISKFHYREGVRRYFYLMESCLIATFDERDATSEEINERKDKVKELEVFAADDSQALAELAKDAKSFIDSKMVKIMIRPPMEWEQHMIQDARPGDKFLQEKLWALYEKYYDFCSIEAAKGSEPQMYTFEVGPDDGGWIFFSPIKCDYFDQHLTDDLDPILPKWLAGNEVMECTYGLEDHPLWTMNCSNDFLEAVKKELSELGFTEQVNNYAKCV